nr:threonine/serine dehydratase [Sphingomonas sanxanigenens]
MDKSRRPTVEGVIKALEKLDKIVPSTPLLPLPFFDEPLLCKAESLQPMGAFKLRGAWHRLSDLSEAEKAAGVVAFSSGNHAQGVAWAARRLGIAAAIVMPADAPAAKRESTVALGAEVIRYDRATESREAIAAALAAERGAVLVPSFDDPWVIEGQGTAGLDAVRQMAERGLAAPDRIVIPCGGGGLSAGIALAVPGAEIVVAEPEGWDDMGRSLDLGELVPVGPNPPPTACDALQTTRVSPLTFDVLKARGARGVAVSEAEVAAAQRHAFRHLRVVVEPGGAVALAAVLAGKVAPGKRTLVILSGGNVDAGDYARVLQG